MEHGIGSVLGSKNRGIMIYRSIGKYALVYFVVITALYGVQLAFNATAVSADNWLATLNIAAITAALITLAYAWFSAQPERHYDNLTNLKRKHLILLGSLVLLLGLINGAYQLQFLLGVTIPELPLVGVITAESLSRVCLILALISHYFIFIFASKENDDANVDMNLVIGFFIFAIPLAICAWFVSLVIINFYITSFFLISLVSFKAGKLNFSAHNFVAESIQDFNRQLHHFFDETYNSVIRSWGVNILLVMLYTLVIVPIWCYVTEIRWYWAVLLVVGAFFLHAFLFFSITTWFSRILGRSVVNYINDSVSVDHKDYELVYRFYENFNIQPYIKDNNDQIVKTLHHTIIANLPRPRYAGKTKPSVSLSPTPVNKEKAVSLGLPFKIEQVNLYQAPVGDLPYEDRVYNTAFISEELSFLFVEVTISEVERLESWKGEIVFQFFNQNRIVTGEIKHTLEVTPGYDKKVFAVGWGREEPGTWNPGEYTLDILYQNERIGKVGFVISTNVVPVKKTEERERTSSLPRLPLLGNNTNKATVDNKHGIQRGKHSENTIDYRTMIGEVYQDDIEHVASKLRIGLSILVKCDKIISEHLWNEIVLKSNLKYEVLEVNSLDSSGANYSSLLVAQLRLLKNKLESIKKGDVLVIPHLDLLAGGSAVHLSEAGRELAQLLYWNIDNPILAFTDVSFAIPDIISSRFSLLRSITGIPKTLKTEEGIIPTAQTMLTKGELSFFESFNPQELYRIISGMNPIKIRQAITYAISERPSDSLITMEQLKNAILNFKSKTSSFFAVPNVKFSHIGGYHDVKAELDEAIHLIQGHSRGLKDDLRKELTPKGFIFYGPPGTGKTLMAKAVANKLNANVMIVSGPETKDMYVGESERKIREIFADARRNAPSVLVFDEFDSIATKRSDRQDGSASVGNSMVAQILTEMDGFRPEAPVLVIGTTNRLDIIDEALLRPSRFKPISVDLPDNEARRKIVEIYLTKFEINLSEELVDSVALSTNGFNGDEIQFVFKRLAIELNLKNLERELVPLKLGEIVGEVKYQKEKQSISANSLNLGIDRRSTYRIEVPVDF